ncbi:hypothetical protein E2320_004641 [Naja naja]|nr:hypothetical protein E2320_004641 [Naja naja]
MVRRGPLSSCFSASLEILLYTNKGRYSLSISSGVAGWYNFSFAGNLEGISSSYQGHETDPFFILQE